MAHLPGKSTEMFINMQDTPVWDPGKHYFDQKTSTIQFYEEEFEKIKNGVNIGGYHMHPWLYFHLNFFKTPIPTAVSGGGTVDLLKNPPLDDNSLYISANLEDAEKLNKVLFLFGCRGFSKSSFLASYTQQTILTKPDGNFSIIGGDEGDLKSISSLMVKSFNSINPAFFIPTIQKDWESYVSFGFKDKSTAGKTYVHSEIRITNAVKGSGGASEKGAGLSPIGYIMDEALHEDTLVYTPSGKVAIKDIQIGDEIYAGNGKVTRVYSKINPHAPVTFKFIFDNNTEITSSPNHRWPISFAPGFSDFNFKMVTASIAELWIKNPDSPIYVPTYDFQTKENNTTRISKIVVEDSQNVYCIGVEHESETFIIEGGIVTKNCGKYAFKDIFESAIPSFKTQYGYKLVPILSGTSGNVELSKDAREVLENPDVFDILPMNFERLNNMVPPEFITWDKDFKKKFGTFVPGQMSYRLLTPRIDRSLSDFVGISSPELKRLKVKSTDWAKAKEEIDSLGGTSAKEKTKDRNKMYYPLELDHCFLTKGANPFPTTIINKRIRELEESGKAGRAVEIIKDGAEYHQKFSEKRKADVRHKGGSIDAPIMLYSELPEKTPERYKFVSGLDDYKLNESDTDSLGAFYVIKRRNLEINSPCETVVASYVSRPDRHRDFHKTLETMIEVWAAECLMEAVDVSFEEYLELKGKAAKWLAPAITFAKSKDSRNNTKLQKKYGLFPTAGNNEHRMNVLVDWCWEEHTIGIDDEGVPITKYSVEFLDDIELLIELRDWQKGKNSDRKEAFSHALLHAHQLDADGIRPKSQQKNTGVLRFNLVEPENSGTQSRRAESQKSVNRPYSSRKMSAYSFRR